ncbi:MAG: PIN domain-containing protein [Synergistaceae bacterium]|nr:PIN domain-containing protein [Synergistaceae bacterium]
MLIYLDNCCYNRPFDDQLQFKIRLETQAKLQIQKDIIDGKHKLIWSYVLDYENSKNPFMEKREAIAPLRDLAVKIVVETDEIINFAEKLKVKGIKTFDALHIACAVSSNCDYYLTTDRKLLRSKINEINIADPIQFIFEQGEYLC